MSWKAEFSNRFLKKHRRFTKTIKVQVSRAASEVLKAPYSGIPLVGPLKGLWRWRTGKYRIIYSIDPKERVVRFVTVELRRKVYK